MYPGYPFYCRKWLCCYYSVVNYPITQRHTRYTQCTCTMDFSRLKNDTCNSRIQMRCSTKEMSYCDIPTVWNNDYNVSLYMYTMRHSHYHIALDKAYCSENKFRIIYEDRVSAFV